MRLSLDLKGPELEVALKSDAIQLKNAGNTVEIKVSDLPALIQQLELVTQLINVSGGVAAPAPQEAPKPAPAPAPAPAPKAEAAPEPPKAAPPAPKAAPAAPAAPKAAPAAAKPAPAPAKPAPEPPKAAPEPPKPAPAKAAAKAAPAAKPAPAPAPAPEPAPAAKGKGKVAKAPVPAQPLRDHFEDYLREHGKASTEELMEFVRKNKLSEKKNLKLAVTIALGREARRFEKNDDGTWSLRR